MKPEMHITPKIPTENGYIKNGFAGIIKEKTTPSRVYEKRKPQVELAIEYFNRKEHKKARRAARVLVMSDLNTNKDIFEVMKQRGFATNPATGKDYTDFYLFLYLNHLRKMYNRPVLEKRDMVLKLYNQGMCFEDIRDQLKSTMSYIRQIEADNKIKIPRRGGEKKRHAYDGYNNQRSKK